MIIEDYCSFEVAKLLKEKGFDAECRAAYTNYGKLFTTQIQQYITNALCSRGYLWDCTAPTLQMAIKWLREVHKLSVRARYDEVEDEEEHLYYAWFFDVLSMNPYKILVEPVQGYSTYEEACEAALKYSLEYLI